MKLIKLDNNYHIVSDEEFSSSLDYFYDSKNRTINQIGYDLDQPAWYDQRQSYFKKVIASSLDIEGIQKLDISDLEPKYKTIGKVVDSHKKANEEALKRGNHIAPPLKKNNKF